MTPDLQRRRFALFVLFFIPGLSISSWVTRTPAIRDRIGASIAEMGIVLLGISVGSMTGILIAGFLVSKYGTKSVALLGTALIPTGLLVMGGGVAMESMSIVALGLCFFGLGTGLGEIAINIDGALVEQLSQTSFMHFLHGCFSFGTICGAVAGFALTAARLPVEWHLSLVAVLTIPAIAYFIRFIPGKNAGQHSAGDGQDMQAHEDPFLKDARLYLIGLIILAVALAEGAANDWLPILMVDEHGFSKTAGSLVFLIFACAMTLGRFSGGYFLDRFGRTNVIRASAILGAVGLSLVILSNNPVLAGAAVILWGLGASLGFPVAISAAGSSGPNSGGRVKLVTIGGYIAFLAGPPFLGLLGESYGLRTAMLVVLTFLLLAVVAAGAVRPRSAARQSRR